MRSSRILVVASLLVTACSSSSSPSDTTTPPAAPPPPATTPPVAPPNPPPPPAEAGCAPKTGFESAAVLGATGGSYGYYHASMVLGASDAPRVAYVAIDPNEDNDGSDSELRFVGYDASTCTWRAPVVVDIVKTISTNHPLREVSVARDAATGELAIAYVVSTSSVDSAWLARSSDDGVTWTKEQVETTIHTAHDPVVAIGGGKTHFAVWENYNLAGGCSVPSECSAFHYYSRTGSSGAFTDGGLVSFTTAGGARGAEPVPGAMALDSANDPALVFVSHPDSSNQTLEVRYWRPSVSPVLVFDSQDTQDDFPAADLAFDGTKPRIAASLERSTDANGRNIWFSASDDGTTWGAPVQLPADGTDSMGVFVSIAASGGKTSVASDWIASSGTHAFGGPKLSTSTDLSAWTTVGADTMPSANDSLGFAGSYLTVRQASTGKRVMAFVYEGDSSAVAKGIVVWREP